MEEVSTASRLIDELRGLHGSVPGAVATGYAVCNHLSSANSKTPRPGHDGKVALPVLN